MLVVNKFCFKALLLLSAGLLSTSAQATEISAASKPAQDLMKAAEGMKCNASQYQSQSNPSAPPKSGCDQCMAKMRETYQQVDSATAEGITKDRAISSAGAAGTKMTAAMNTGKQEDSQNKTKDAQDIGKQSQAERTANAKKVGSAFEKCKSDIQSSCQESQLVGDDKNSMSKGKQACEEGAKTADAVAAEKAGSGMDMSKMGEMAGKAAEMMQQMMKKKEEGAKDAAAAADQAASGIAAPAEATLASNKVGGASQFAQSATFDGLNGTQATTDAAGTTAGAGNGAQAQSYTHGTDGSDTGTNGSDPRGGAGISSGGGSYSPMAGGGSGGGNSSGASSYDPNAEAAKAAAGGADPTSGAYEISSGGGGGSKFLGLKSKSAELSDLDGALGGESGAGLNLAVLGAEGEGRDPASEGSTQNADIHADGSSLFNVVRSKLVEIKKRGNI